MSERLQCPLCHWATNVVLHRDSMRDYYRCMNCELVFVPPQRLPDQHSEKAIYDQHQNNPDDQGYRRFLRRLTDPLEEKLPQQAQGLDFGSGPGPTLSVMMQESGFEMQIYDPIYQPDESVLDAQYDFITATEVFEHLHKPAKVIQLLMAMMRPAGWLGVMTKRIPEDKPFAEWHYTRDPTHVIFFAVATFDWIADQYDLQPEFIGNDVVLLQKIHQRDTEYTEKKK